MLWLITQKNNSYIKNSIPVINSLDNEMIYPVNSNVWVYKYYSESSLTEFVHYQVYGGGHEWFGIRINGLEMEEIMWNFFSHNN